ncbi:uncharacterized protein LOC121869090 [Homarus americanus]|nr:uncharacterized protein LOC121869090 [Homarus americanus]
MTSMSQGIRQDDLAPQVFVTQMMSLPVLHDALTLATSLYCSTKEQQYVGVALQAAEVSVWAVANTALPLATPLVERVVGWAVLDKWACKGLDRVKEAAPIITKSTREIVRTTRNLVLTTLAGDVGSDDLPPPTVGAALTTRATYTVGCITESSGGRVAVGMADRFLDSAHTLVDTYFPPHDGDLHDSDGRDGSLGMKVAALADKSCRRFKRGVHTTLNVNSNQELDDDDIIITSGHLLELGRRSLFSWYIYVTRQHLAGRGGKIHSLLMDGAETMHSKVMQGAGTVWSLVTSGMARVQEMTTSGKTGSVVIGGVHMVNDVVMDGVDVVKKVMTTGMNLAHNVVGNGLSISHTALNGSLNVMQMVIVSGKDITYSVVTIVISTAHITVTSGVGIPYKVVMHGKTMAQNIVSGGMKATTRVSNSIYPIVTNFTLNDYTQDSDDMARSNTNKAFNTIYIILKYVQGFPGGVMAWVDFLIQPDEAGDKSTDDQVYEEPHSYDIEEETEESENNSHAYEDSLLSELTDCLNDK